MRPTVFRSAHDLLALAGTRLSLAALGFVASLAAGQRRARFFTDGVGPVRRYVAPR